MVKILYEDKYLVVAVKPVGYLSQTGTHEEESMVTELSKYRHERGEKADIYVVHRLDQNVGGVMVFAKTSSVASKLSVAIQKSSEFAQENFDSQQTENSMNETGNVFLKEYLAVIKGCPKEPKGVLKDYLFKDSKKNKSFVVNRIRKGVKKASLEYTVLDSKNIDNEQISIVRIKLHTGRTHQIRVQFASRKMPLLGDSKYGSRDNRCNIALWSYYIEFNHPVLKKRMQYQCSPNDIYPFNIFN